LDARAEINPAAMREEPAMKSVQPAILAIAAAMVVAAPFGAASADDMQSIKVVERATTDAVTDTGKEGDTVGDLLTFANEVYDEANANKIGSDTGWCIRTVAGASWECAWTLSLSDGQINVAGPFLDAGDSVLAIVGGTGAYAGARGEMKLHARDAKGSEYDFAYSVMK
jgi:allene oxide cyclase